MERAAAARPGIANRITDVIDRLVGAGRPINDSLQRPGPGVTYLPVTTPVPAPCDSSDDEVDEYDAETSAATLRTRKLPRNPFILDEAAEAEDDEEDEDQLENFDSEYIDYEFIDDD